MRNRPKPRSARHALEGNTPMRTGVSRGDYEAVHSDPAGGCGPSRVVERIPLVLEGVSGYEIDAVGAGVAEEEGAGVAPSGAGVASGLTVTSGVGVGALSDCD